MMAAQKRDGPGMRTNAAEANCYRSRVRNSRALARHRALLGESDDKGQRDRALDQVHVEPVECRAHHMVPYGCEVTTLVAQGRRLNVYVFAVPHPWDQAKVRRAAMGEGSCVVLPWGESPLEYRWPQCPHGLTVDARGRSRAEALEIGRCIVSAGTPLAFVVGEGFGFPVKSPTWCSPLADPAEAA